MTEITLEHNEGNILTFSLNEKDEDGYLFAWFRETFEKCGWISCRYEEDNDILVFKVEDFNLVRGENWEALASLFAKANHLGVIASYIPYIDAINQAKSVTFNDEGEVEEVARLGWSPVD